MWTGGGARDYGGRWNSKGNAVVYVSESLSLAVLEILVHLDSDEILTKFVKCSVNFDDSLVQEYDLRKLPSNWRDDPSPSSLRAIGDTWIEEAHTVILAVPSVVIPAERNYLINPAHSDFPKLAIGDMESFLFDPRLA
jgi:RES domain-containing protein